MSGPARAAQARFHGSLRGYEHARVCRGHGIAYRRCATYKVLNRTYRHQNTPTDVLSFAQRDPSLENAGLKPALPADGGEYLGDIAISMPRVQAQAAAYGHKRGARTRLPLRPRLSAPHWARSFRRNRPHEDARARRSHSHRSRPAAIHRHNVNRCFQTTPLP